MCLSHDAADALVNCVGSVIGRKKDENTHVLVPVGPKLIQDES